MPAPALAAALSLTDPGQLVAAAAAALVATAAAAGTVWVRLRRRTASARPSALSATSGPAAGDPATRDGGTADAGTGGTDVGERASDDTLTVNPLTGTAHTPAGRPGRDHTDAPPARRPHDTTPTTGLTTTGDIPFADAQPAGAPPLSGYVPASAAAAAHDAADVDLPAVLTGAFAARDIDTLAALARQLPQHAGAAHLLAAVAAAAAGDPRTFGHLRDAADLVLDPSTLVELDTFRDQLTLPVTLPPAHVDTTVPATRTGLAVALAAAEYSIGDVVAARAALTRIEDHTELSALVTATINLQAGHADSARAALAALTHAPGHDTPDRATPDCDAARTGYTAALAVPAVELALEAQPWPDLGAARSALTAAAAALPHTDPGVDAAELTLTLQCLSARIAATGGDRARAWAALTGLLERHPGHAYARSVLATL